VIGHRPGDLDPVAGGEREHALATGMPVRAQRSRGAQEPSICAPGVKTT
jgi:hypothetical protein